MKKLLLTLLPALFLSTAAAVPTVKAQDAMPSIEVSMKLTLTPFNLAYLAYHGYFTGQGVPEYNRLMDAFRAGKVDGDTVVKAAVKDNRLPASFLNNDAYIKAVTTQLYSLSINNR